MTAGFKLPFEIEQDETRGQQENDALKLAMLHAVFLTDSGAELLRLWKRTLRSPVPAGSPPDVYARKQAMREFIDTIEDQIEIAKRAH